MQRLIATNSVPLSGADTQPTSGTPQYATDGVPGTTSPTIWPAYAWNMAQDEIVNAVDAAGLTPSGTNWAQLAQAIGIIGRRQVVITSSTTFTVPAGIYLIDYIITGGGGGGANAAAAFPPSGSNEASGGGGGSGGTVIGTIAVTPGQVLTVTVGAGGTAQVTGGTSSITGVASATGGLGASFTSSGLSAGSGPGVGSGGAINLEGGWGGDGQSGVVAFAGNGGASYWGGGVRAFAAGGGGPTTGPYGAGGGGTYNGSGNGAAGIAGVVVLRY
jgi:hypothetical protein